MSSSDSPETSGSRNRSAELKRTYKEKPPPMGVYAIRNRANGKVLVGTSLNLPGFLNRARFQLELGGHPHPALQADWQRYGVDSFSFEVLDKLPPSEEPREALRAELEVLEALWLERLKPYGEAGYNTPPP